MAMEQLVTELLPYTGRICGAIALDRGDDALQEAMMAIVKNLGRLREPAALRGWVRTIAVREAMRATRHTGSTPYDPKALEELQQSLDGTTAVDVREVLGSLPPDQRAVLVLRHVDGLSEQETAAVLGVATGTVKSRTNRARHSFRQRWST